MGKWRRRYSIRRRRQRNWLISKYGNICYLCGDDFLRAKDITFDHWVPRSRGGSDDVENLRLAHSQCNQLKKNLTPEEYLEFQEGK